MVPRTDTPAAVSHYQRDLPEGLSKMHLVPQRAGGASLVRFLGERHHAAEVLAAKVTAFAKIMHTRIMHGCIIRAWSF